MSSEKGLEELRAALLGPGGGPVEVDEGDLERIRSALAGELGREELDELLGRVAAEPELARAWRLARELRVELGPAAVPSAAVAGRWLWAAGAAAAALAAALVIAVRLPGPRIERAPGATTILATTPEAEPLPRDAFRLEWRPVASGARYTVEVLDGELELVDRASDLAASEHTVDPVRLERLEAGSILYWRVEALLPDGERLDSPTFVQTLK